MRLLLFLSLLLLAECAASLAGAAENEPIVYYDATSLLKLDLKDPAQRRRCWDETHLLVSLQGLVNRTAPRLYLRYVQEPDDFWWDRMTEKGGWLADRKVERIPDLETLLRRFRTYYKGAVAWDERVPAGSNLASTIAGCDSLLCLRYDASAGSLYRRLTETGLELPVKTRLMKENGSPLFTGRGVIPGTTLASSGSAKCDAYLWLIEKYVRTGKTNPKRMGYYLDGDWLRSWSAGSPQNHTISNQDYTIAQKGVLFDLNPWDDEACVDDPAQKPGTDSETLKRLLRASYDRFQGDGFIHVAGFVPWAYKYTDFKCDTWSAGGKHEGVPTEWRYAEILSCFNAYMDADAIGLGAMANASFYQHYPLKAKYAQNPKPTTESLIKKGILDSEGHIAPRCYVAHYVGDYDSAAWLYQKLPEMWRDPKRGTTPLSWAFNPDLAERFPLGMAWARENQTPNDWFIAGDSGAGYLNPGYLSTPRVHSGLPSGVAAWDRYCKRYYEQWDLSVTGFVIDGYAPGLTKEGLDAYADFSPDGIVAQKIPKQGMYRAMPFVRMRTDVDGTPEQAARAIYAQASGPKPRFVVCRSILKTPTWYAGIEQELKKLAGDDVKIVDMYTLFQLVREYETHLDRYVDSRYAKAAEVSARPDRREGLEPIFVNDGPFTVEDRDGAKVWRIPGNQPPFYIYFDVNDLFYKPGGGPVEIEVEYLDSGSGRIELQYDSTDRTGAVEGAYKGHALVVTRTNSGEWRKAAFLVEDAAFTGRQNGSADFRLYSNGDDLRIRSVRVRKK